MAKTNTPFFSFGSRGSVGESLTTQKRGRDTVIRQLPLPTDPHSLPQRYQRWLYEDYAYLWTLQSLATKRQYSSSGSRFHLTGFQYWMKYWLTTLGDIRAYWKLDSIDGATSPDSSRQANDLAIFGASPANGKINGAYEWDGINDYMRVTSPTLMDWGTGDFAIILSFYPTAYTNAASTWEAFLLDTNAPEHPNAYQIEMFTDNYGVAAMRRHVAFGVRNAAGVQQRVVGDIPSLNTWHTIAAMRHTLKISISLDGGSWVTNPGPADMSFGTPNHIDLGKLSSINSYYLPGRLDTIFVRGAEVDLPFVNKYHQRSARNNDL